jgi:hypothetical protein
LTTCSDFAARLPGLQYLTSSLQGKILRTIGVTVAGGKLMANTDCLAAISYSLTDLVHPMLHGMLSLIERLA